jgi:acetylglutamate kinase
MVLVGKVNKEIVEMINQAGGRAVGLCGRDGRTIQARRYAETEDAIGFVGDIASIDVQLISTLLKAGYIPVISSVSSDSTGQAYNINADTAAGELAAALEAEKLILLTDTPGLLQQKDDPNSLIQQLDLHKARHLIETGIVAGGMIPKLQCCIRALAQGVRSAHILDGRLLHSLLLEIFTDEGVGTMLVSSERHLLIEKEHD